jgi:hypothetical protein
MIKVELPSTPQRSAVETSCGHLGYIDWCEYKNRPLVTARIMDSPPPHHSPTEQSLQYWSVFGHAVGTSCTNTVKKNGEKKSRNELYNIVKNTGRKVTIKTLQYRPEHQPNPSLL